VIMVRRDNTTLDRLTNKYVLTVALSIVALCGAAPTARAQQMTVTIRVIPESARAVIEGNSPPTTSWSFRDSYAGVLGLGNRIESFRLFDAHGLEISTRKIAPGQFDAATPASTFRYEVNLAPPIGAAEASMVSWVNQERGLLMLGELLPGSRLRALTNGEAARVANENTESRSVSVKLDLPDGWLAYSNERQTGPRGFETTDGDRAVFAIGNHLRGSRRTVSEMTLTLVADGQWAFEDSDAIELAARVIKAHREVLGSMPTNRATLILIPFPQQGAGNKWSAETRGSTVTLLMGKVPSKIGALAQLSTPLTHELFHLWVPNGLALDGDYDWFYEGFTVYQAARTAVRLDLLTFPEFLNAIARAYDAYLAGVDHDRWSLVEASKRRWTVGQSSVYSKSMVIAFLYDLTMRSESHGKHSLDVVYRKIFQGHRLSDSGSAKEKRGSDGNETATIALAFDTSSQDFVRVFLKNPVTIDLKAALARFGLGVETFGLRTRITVDEKLNKQQRDLLRELGYNAYVR
jgi:hypothetical protein